MVRKNGPCKRVREKYKEKMKLKDEREAQGGSLAGSDSEELAGSFQQGQQTADSTTRAPRPSRAGNFSQVLRPELESGQNAHPNVASSNGLP